MALLVLLNNFIHDFSAAGWIFGSVVLYVILRRRSTQRHPDRAILDVLKAVRFLMRLCLFGIIVFGVFRTIAYRTYEWNRVAGNDQVTLLIVKHIFFTVIFVIGLMGYIKSGKLLKKAMDEKE